MVKWFLTLETNERKNLALAVMFGSGLVFTIYGGIALWLLAASTKYIFWLAIVAHIQIFSTMTGFIALLVRRRIGVGKDGVFIDDEEETK